MEQQTVMPAGMIYTGASTGNYDSYGAIAANQCSEIRADVGQVKSDLQAAVGNHAQHLQNRIGDLEGKITGRITDTLSAVHDAECAITKNDNDIAHRSTIHLNSVERDLQNQILGNRAILTKEIGDKTEIVRTQMLSFERENANKFCKLEIDGLKNTQSILDRIDASERRALKDELDETRLSKYYDKMGYQFGLQNQEITNMKAMINSQEYNQKVTSSIKQFGTGLVAVPTQTSNVG